MPDCPALLQLALAGGPVRPRRALLQAFGGDAAAALRAGPGAWREAGLQPAQISRLRPPDDAARRDLARACRWLDAPGHHLLGCMDADFPPLLAQTPHPPLALFVAGEPGHLWHPQIAIVGSRAATSGGLDNARQFAGALARAGFAITSGLAAGIDAAAHGAALDAGGLTIAVIATGPDRTYPLAHQALQARIAQHGCVVSEYPPGVPPLRSHFPARNRLIAGLALGTLVIEAGERSGALISARLAAEAGREVFAVPGSIHNPQARGCHRLLRQGACLASDANEVGAALGALATGLGAALRQRLRAGVAHVPEPEQAHGDPCPDAAPSDPEHHKLWSALGHDPSPMDALVERTGLTVAQLSPMLLALELEGRVAVEHGRYTRKSA
ncbi:DNA-processing protein DprA [Luteimonas sp. e5]